MVMVYGSEKEYLWFMVNGEWFMMNGSGLMVHGHIRFMVNGSRFMIIHYGREEKLL